MKEFLKDWWQFLSLATAFILIVGWALVSGYQHGKENRAKCDAAHGVYISGGKGEGPICLTGTNLKVVELNK